MPETDTPLFPLRAVLFPGGLLGLKVFEARYLDLVTRCLRERRPFGVVALKSGHEVQGRGEVAFESIGTLAELMDVDSEQANLLHVRCRGGQRFELAEAPRQTGNGLWTARTTVVEDDPSRAPTPEQVPTVRALANAIAALKNSGKSPFLEPLRFDDAGWVANRWCEILEVPLGAKQRLMALADPIVRLQLVDDYLRSKGVVT